MSDEPLLLLLSTLLECPRCHDMHFIQRKGNSKVQTALANERIVKAFIKLSVALKLRNER